MPGRVHILVLNYNGQQLLDECLPSVVACARAAQMPCRVTLIDNESSDGSVEFVREHWPDVTIEREPNRFLVSFNDVVARLDEPIVLLLNNDVKLSPGCVDRLAAPFATHADCFATSPLCWTFDGRYEGTLSDLVFRRGLVHTHLRPPAELGAARYPSPLRATASAGAVLAVNRAKFLALGGFDSLYLPGRFEDLDLAFRAWLAGWKSYFVPDTVAYHKGSASFGPHVGSRGDELDARNALLFAWKNLREPRHVAAHGFFLTIRVLRALATGHTAFLRGWVSAMTKLPAVLRRRRAVAPPRVRSERELFQILGAADE